MPATWLFRRLRDPAPSILVALTIAVASTPVRADQGGISFWLPGAFGSLAATLVTPGWAMGTIFLNEFVNAGGEVASSRAIRLGNRTANLNVTLDARLNAAQLTADSGSGATLGDFKSRVFGIGPQVGYIFPVGDMQGYLNLRGYGEFGARNRAEGRNMWLTFAISPSAEAAMAAKPIVRK